MNIERRSSSPTGPLPAEPSGSTAPTVTSTRPSRTRTQGPPDLPRRATRDRAPEAPGGHLQSAGPQRFLPQGGLPPGQTDSGGISAMVKKFRDPENLGELFTAMTDAARVKRHNTASWVSGNIKNSEYSRLYVPLAELRPQHSIDGKAVAKTEERAQRIFEWLQQYPDAKTIDLQTLDELAGSPGALKVGHGSNRQFIMIDGTGRLAAIRQALDLYAQRTERAHPLESVETYAAQLSDEEYSQLHAVSAYFLDDDNQQRAEPIHDLAPGSAVPRLVVGTVMNQIRHGLQLDPAVERRIDAQLDTARHGLE